SHISRRKVLNSRQNISSSQHSHQNSPSMASVQQQQQVPVQVYGHTSYRGHLNNGVQVGACVVGARLVSCLGFTGLSFLISGIVNIAVGSSVGSHVNLTIGIVLASLGGIMVVASIVVGCIAYKSYKNTTLTNPAQPYNPNAAYPPGYSTPYASAGAPVHSTGTGFSSQYNYSAPGGIGATQPPPPPGYPVQPGGLPPPYYAPNPSAPNM
ncbi:unnamed protein product, partial [Meganyctiphanes norvegica]